MKADPYLISNKQETALVRIRKYYSDENAVVLTSQEQNILDRWIFCNALLKERRYREEQIIQKLMHAFKVSKYTARADIGNTQALFSTVTREMKRYMLKTHAEDLQLLIHQYKLDKSLAGLVPRIAHAYTKAVEAIPEESAAENMPAPIIIINVVEGQKIDPPMDVEAAMLEADMMIQDKKKEEYTDFEDLPDAT